MATKFTPAPWSVDFGSTQSCITGGKGGILYVHTIDSGKGKSQRRIANEHLIAVAPEMYELLQDLLSAEGVITTSSNRKSVKELLAKARGEA